MANTYFWWCSGLPCGTRTFLKDFCRACAHEWAAWQRSALSECFSSFLHILLYLYHCTALWPTSVVFKCALKTSEELDSHFQSSFMFWLMFPWYNPPFPWHICANYRPKGYVAIQPAWIAYKWLIMALCSLHHFGAEAKFMLDVILLLLRSI